MAWDTHMKVDINGSDVPGVSDRWPDEVDVKSVEWGMDTDEMQGSNSLGRAQPQNLVVTKDADSTSPLFLQALTQNQNMNLTIKQTGEGTGEVYWEFEFKNCRVAAVSWSGNDSSGEVEETLSIKYSELTQDVFSYGDDGSQIGTATAQWINAGEY